MKKITMLALLGMVSWALVGTPAQAAEIPHHKARHHKMAAKNHKKSHKKHKNHKKA